MKMLPRKLLLFFSFTAIILFSPLLAHTASALSWTTAPNASPNPVPYNTNTTVSWGVTGATSCTMAFVGAVSSLGATMTIGPIQAYADRTITCSDGVGGTLTGRVDIYPKPVVTGGSSAMTGASSASFSWTSVGSAAGSRNSSLGGACAVTPFSGLFSQPSNGTWPSSIFTCGTNWWVICQNQYNTDGTTGGSGNNSIVSNNTAFHAPFCGDGVCESSQNNSCNTSNYTLSQVESTANCPVDCPAPPTGTWTAPTCPVACGLPASNPPYTCVGGNGLCAVNTPATLACPATAACPTGPNTTFTGTYGAQVNQTDLTLPAGGGTVNLNWSVTNAIGGSCVGSSTAGIAGWAAGGTSGKPVTGTNVPVAVSNTTRFDLDCKDAGGTPAPRKSVGVTVTGGSALTICPAGATMTVGGAQQLRSYYSTTGANANCALANPADNVTMFDATAKSHWSSNNSSFATVVANGASAGLVSAVGAGIPTITASHDPWTDAATYSGPAAQSTTTVNVNAVICTSNCAATANNYCAGVTFTTKDSCNATESCTGTRSCNFNWREVSPLRPAPYKKTILAHKQDGFFVISNTKFQIPNQYQILDECSK